MLATTLAVKAGHSRRRSFKGRTAAPAEADIEGYKSDGGVHPRSGAPPQPHPAGPQASSCSTASLSFPSGAAAGTADEWTVQEDQHSEAAADTSGEERQA